MGIAVIVSIVSLVFSVFFGLFTLGFNLKNSKHTDTKDVEERVERDTRINIKLDSISTNTADIKTEVAEMRKEVNSHNDRLIKVEESIKQAHHRISEVAERLNSKED